MPRLGLATRASHSLTTTSRSTVFPVPGLLLCLDDRKCNITFVYNQQELEQEAVTWLKSATQRECRRVCVCVWWWGLQPPWVWQQPNGFKENPSQGETAPWSIRWKINASKKSYRWVIEPKLVISFRVFYFFIYFIEACVAVSMRLLIMGTCCGCGCICVWFCVAELTFNPSAPS